MKVLIAGATGFIGSHLTPALLAAGHEVVALVRPGSENKLTDAVREHASFRILFADPLRPETLEDAPEGLEAMIDLIGIIEEAPSDGITYERVHVESTRNLVELARRRKVRKILHMSALGAREMAATQYYATKYRGEGIVKASGIPWVVFRPGLVYGRGDQFMTRLVAGVRPFLPVPVFGSGFLGTGQAPLQPVAVEDVVTGFVKALADETVKGRIYEFAGPRKVTLDEIVTMIASVKHADPLLKVPTPIWLMRPIATLSRVLFPGFPFTSEQLVMMEDGSESDDVRFFRDFGIEARDFTVESIAACV